MTERCLASRAVVQLSPRESDEDVIGFLQGLLTNDVRLATAEAPIYAALLSAQGKTMFDLLVWAGEFAHGPGLLLDCEADVAEDLVKRLSLYRLRRKIDIAVMADAWIGWCPPADETDAGNDPRLPGLGHRSLRLSGRPAETADQDYLAHRLALGVPEGRHELGDVLWLETNAVELNGVSFTKGCYIGQENTARMNWRQKVNRRLVVVPLELSEEKRRKAAYPALGLAVDHLRVEDISGQLKPVWLSLAPADQAAR